MKNIFSGIVFLAILGFSGCSMKLEQKLVRVPEISKFATAEIGQSMYEKYSAFYPVDINNSVELILDNDENRKKFSKYNSHTLYLKKTDNGECVGIGKNGFKIFTDKTCSKTFSNCYSNKLRLNCKVPYKLVTLKPVKITQQSFKYEVLYQGRTSDKINISFREFVGDKLGNLLIRSDFTQNIEYKLDKNGEALIGFKGLRIKVLKATNFDIEYKVLKDFQ